MNIGLFGDSFACKKMRTHKRYEGHPGFANIGKPWFEYLPHEITSFGESGSDLYYSYNLYLENRHKFDKNIFIATSPGRLSIKNLKEEYLHYNSHIIAQKHKTRTGGFEADFLDSVIRYFKHILDNDKEKLICNLIKKDIMQDKDCLFVEGFGPNGLITLFQMENKIWNISFKDNHNPKVRDFRYCHMTEQNNIIFADQIQDCIANNKQYIFDLEKFAKPSVEEKNRYIFNTEDLEVWLGDIDGRRL